MGERLADLAAFLSGGVMANQRGRPRASADISPYKLTANEARAMDALCEHGTEKLACHALGIWHSSMSNITRTAMVKLEQPGNRVLAILTWDRWRRTL